MDKTVDMWFMEKVTSPESVLFAQWREKIPSCPYTITRGKRKGEPCGKSEIRPLEIFTTFNPMCFDHMKHWTKHPQYVEFMKDLQNLSSTDVKK
jgi:hypothetical protein